MIRPKLNALTNKQIDNYVLKGNYGEAQRQSMLKAIKRGDPKFKYLDARIRKGEFGPDAQAALAARPRRKSYRQQSSEGFDRIWKNLGLNN